MISIACDTIQQEKGNSELSAKTEIETDFGINVSSIINLDALIDYSHTNQNFHSYKIHNVRSLRGIIFVPDFTKVWS